MMALTNASPPMEVFDCSPFSLVDSFLSTLLLTVPLTVALWWTLVRNGTATIERLFIEAGIYTLIGTLLKLAVLHSSFCN
jgi:hypothetical protein